MNRFRKLLPWLFVFLVGFILMNALDRLRQDGTELQSSDKPAELPSLMGDHKLEAKMSAVPAGSSTRNVSEGRRVQLPRQDNAKLQEVAKKRESHGVYRFAQGMEVHMTPSSAGQWSTLAGGLRRWILEVESPGALSLNFGFRRYRMPEGGRLTIYPRSEGRGGEGTRVFSDLDNEEHGQLWTPLFPGAELILEADLPAGKERELELELSQVNHGFRGFEKALKAVGDSLQKGCELDVACSAETLPGLGTVIDFYRNQIKAVGAFTLGGVEVASGALINNAARDGRPFFLTAYHTGVDSQNAPSMVVYWNFQNSVCRGPNCCGNSDEGDGNLDQFNTGAIFRSGYAKTDMTLVELDDPLDPAHKLYYAGWDRSLNQASQSSCVHHPGVSEKRISLSFNATTTTSWLGASAPGDGSHARVVWSNGITEPGSSGSPLFNQGGRIIGQLHGGDSKCDGTGADWYGRLSMSWDGGGTPVTRLKDWLDPANTGVTTLDGIHPLPFLSISDATVVEGSAGSQSVAFKVTLSPSLAQQVTVAYATVPGTATSTSDYSATSGTLTFQPGETQKFVTVQVQGDATPESDEQFLVRLSGAAGAPIYRSDGVGLVLNDDYIAPSITSPLSIHVDVGRPIGYSIAAANTPRTYGLGGAAPAGMSINSANGSIEWAPPAPGTYSVQIIASNPGGSDTKTLVIDAAYRSVDLSSGLPPVADQGILSSSAAWAACYYYKSFQEAREHGWSLTDPAHQFSPSFAINQYGAASLLLGEVMALLDERGCAPLSLVPYTDDDTSTWPSYDGCLAALPYRSKSHRALGGEGTPEIIQRMRAHLNSGDLCVFQFPLFRSTLESPGSFEALSAGNERYEMPSSDEAVITDYPAVAVVGYDDSKFDGRGGFRVIGSFGPEWGRQGLAWVSYDFVKSFSLGVYTMEDRIGYAPAATARISVSHNPSDAEDILTLTLGTGDEGQPRWSSDVMKALSLNADFAVDLTETESLLPPSPSQQWWLKAQNDDYGSGRTTIRRFEIQVGASSQSAAGDLPVSNSGDGVRSTKAQRCVLPGGPTQYYVNDTSQAGDQHTSAVGNDNNDGLTPATPKASLQALIQTYHLRGGDTVWIDAGTYPTPCMFTETDSGRSGVPLVIRGALLMNGEPGSIFDLSGITTTSVVTFANGAGNVRMEKLWLKGGLNNVSQNDSSYRDHSLSFTQVRFSGSSQEACSVYGGSNADFWMDHCVVAGAKLRLRGCHAVLRNCTVRGPAGSSCLEKQFCDLNVYDSILSAQGSNALLNDLDSGGSTASVRVFRFCVLQASTLGFTPDSTNINGDPQFASAAAGDLHLKSTAGRWDPSMNGGTGDWVVDAVDSPAIDAGDPEALVGDETSPTGGRLNAGAYGGTRYASRSGANPVRRLVLTSPSTGGTLRGRVDVSWSVHGVGWQGGDSVRLEYSADGGTTWNVIPGGGALACNAGSFVWDSAGLTPGATYRLRVVSNADGSVSAAHASNFTLGSATYYYVNDASPVGDRYCGAPGAPGNTGLSPLAPASSIQTILDTNDLEGGDIIFVDAGTYTLASNLTIGSADGGSSTNPVRIVGSPDWGATVIDRNGTSGSYAIYINGTSGVSLENLWVTRGGTGIYVTGSNCQVSKCRVFKNISNGIEADLGSSKARVKNCLVDRNGGTGIRVKGGTGIYAWQEANIEQCTIVGHSLQQVLLTGSTAAFGLLSNIIISDGSGAECIAIDDTAVRWNVSDYNNIFARNGANLGSWFTYVTKVTTLSEWRELSGADSHSMSSEPLFVDPDGADNISGTPDDNYHLQSAGGSWKGAGFSVDATTSPCVDAGSALQPVSDEAPPNGGRINLGAFGGTALASKTPTARVLFVREPVPNYPVEGQVAVVWGTLGLSWQAGDTVMLEFSLNNGLNWQPVAGAGALPYATGRFEWDSTSAGSSAVAKLRVVCNNDGTIAQMSDSFILHNAPLDYYVNDGVLTGDVYCSNAGQGTNDGLSAATPMASIQAVLDRYDLEPGDMVWVDTGTYSIPNGIKVLDNDNGCTLIGSSTWGGTVLQGGGSGSVVKFSGCNGVALANVWLTGGASGVEFNDAYNCSLSISRIYGNSSQGVWNGSYSYSNYCSLSNCLIDLNGSYGVQVGYSNGMRIVNCTIFGHANSDVRKDIFHSVYNLVVKNSIADVSNVSASSIQYSNYNDYYRASAPVQNYGTLVAAGFDRNSFTRDPLFVDPDGPDNIPGNADDDFHLQSAAGSWHGGSFAADAATSPCLDAGAPGDPVGAETMPNGGRVEIGAFGGTSHASRTPSARSLRMLSPNGGDAAAGLSKITWESTGTDWQAGDTVRLEYSLNGGGTWQVVAGASALAHNSGRFLWDDSALSESPVALLRVVANASSVQDVSDGFIRTGPVSYYVNDGSTAGDGGYCSEIGSSSNSGLSPNAPKLSVQEILASYDLGAGDVVYVESGAYSLSGTLQVGSAHSGSSGGLVRVVGPVSGGVAIFARSTTSGPVVQLSGCSYVSLENLFITGGGVGVDLVNAPKCRLTGCRIFKNTGFGVSVASSSSVTLQNCIVDNNGARGVSSSSANFSMSNCTVFGHSSHEVYLFFEETTSVLRNNLVWSNGSGRTAINSDFSAPGISDYNDLVATNGARVGYHSGIARLTLASWQAATGKDAHSISADPLLVDADGVDNVIGTVDDDLHLQSTAGSWHDGLFTADAASSPCIDAGDPASSTGLESAPNGGRINIGAYGGTAQASRSQVPPRSIALLSPTAGSVLRHGSPIRWLLSGSGVQPSDTVSLSYSADAGATWIPIPEGQAIPAASGQADWNILGLTPGTSYRVKVIVDQAPVVAAEVGNFTIGRNYFVNDFGQLGDVYCSAVGSDSNSGSSPNAPMLTLQALLAAKDLEPGDTVFVDAGNYVLGSNVVINAADSGSSPARVIIQGVPGKTILDRNDTVSSSAACLVISGTYVSVDGLHCTRAYKGVSITGSSIHVTNTRIDGCSYRSIDGYEAFSCRIQNCLIVQSGGSGAVVMSRQNNSGILGLTFVNNTVVARGTNAVYLNSSYAPGSTIRNCIFDVIGGVGLKVSSLTVSGQVHDSDYNVFHLAVGASAAYDGKYVNGEFATLPVWQAVTGRDLHSLVADPYFADPTGGDYHLRSAAGRFDPAQNLTPDNPAAWVVDDVNSPAIDAGDPISAVAQESDSNGARVNAGAYGGTSEASRSPASSRHLDLLLSSTTYSGSMDLRWRLSGNAWLASDLLRLEFSTNNGVTWQTMNGASQVRADSLRFFWDTYGMVNGYGYRMRAVLVSSGLPVGASSGYFAIANEGGGSWALHVAPSGGDDGIHGTPAQPFRSVEYALAVADGRPGGTVNVKVAGGSYPGTIAMKEQVKLMGGYSSLDWSRDMASQVSIIDGQGKGPVVTGADDALIEGFTITGGAANSYGGGISCSGVSPSVRSCRILGNAATYRGGGVYVANASPVISSCVIAGNDAPTGDGVYLEWSAAQLRNCTIVNNGGHGIYLDNANLSPQVSNCILWNNGDDLNNVSASYSDVEDSDSGLGVIHLDPQLDPQFRLTTASPCINRGANLSGFQMWPDVDGGGRVLFGTIDIGAHEFAGGVDTDADGLEDWWEIRYFGAVSALLAVPGADGDADGQNNLAEQLANTDPTSSASKSDPSIVDLPSALNAPSLTWISNSWAGQRLVTHDGDAAAKSGPIADGGQSWLEADVTGPCRVSFQWKISSEEGWDYLRLLLDGQLASGVPELTGEVNWSLQTVSIPAGTHKLRWVYSKDEAGAAGADAAWVDEVTLLIDVTIAAQPVSQTVDPNASVTFTVTAGGTGPLSYQWKKNGSNIAGATSASYTIGSAQQSHEGDYTVVVSNAFSSATSNAATLMVNDPVVITSHPEGQTVNPSVSATFTVAAGGSGAFGYQWRKNGGNITGATGASYTIASAQQVDEGSYSVVVSNAFSSATSNTAALTVNDPVVITAQPSSRSVNPNASTSFTVVANGTGLLSYQWRKNGSNIPGATSASYSIASVQQPDGGDYTVVVSNAFSSATSNAATLTVTKAVATVMLGSLSQTYNNTPRAATSTTVPAGLAVNFTYDGSATAPTAAGTYAVVGTINDPVYQGSASGTLVIAKAAQSISFAAIPGKLTTETVNLTASGGASGNPVTFAVTSGAGVITGNVLSFTTSGSVTVTASQAGNSNYDPATPVSRSVTVTKAAATMMLGSLSQTYNNTPRTATATTVPAGLAVNFTYNGSPNPPVEIGTYAVVGAVNDLMYQGSASGSLVIGKAAQSISFAAIPDKLTTDTVALSATGGGSGNAVTFAVTSGPGVITGNVLSFTTSGIVTVTASQAGNSNYDPATPVSRSVTVTKAAATVTLGSLAQTYNNTPRAATSTTVPAGLAVNFTYDGSATAPTAAGTYAVVGTINDPVYQGSASGTLVIGKAAQSISFAAIPGKLTTETVNLTASGGASGNPVTFAVTSGAGVITGNVLSFTTSGSVTVTASQAGNSSYDPATPVSRSVTVTKAAAAVTLAGLVQIYNDMPRAATATTVPAGLAVNFTYDGSATAPTAAGTYAVVGTVNDPMYQGSASGSLVIGKEQSISFAAIADKLTTDMVALIATGGGSGNPVTFAVTSGPGVITGNVLSFTTSGSVMVTASQAGSSDYFAAEDVSRTFNVTKAEAPIAFGQLIQVADGSPRAVTVSTIPAQLVVNLAYAGQASPPSLPGNYEVSATVDDLIYEGTASTTLTVLGLSSLDQPVLSGRTSTSPTNGTDFGNVTLGRVLTRVFTITNPGSTPVTLTGTPLVEVEGEHAGDFVVSLPPETVVPPTATASFELRFAPTQPGIREARVIIASTTLANGPITFALQGFGALPTPRSQTITFNPPATLYLSQLPLTLSATASSGLPVELRLLSTNATLGQGGLLTVPVAGTVKLEARRAGNGIFAAAQNVQRTITVKPDPTGLTLVDLVKTYNGQPQEAGVVGVGDADVEVTYKVVGTVYRTEPPTQAGQYAVKAVAGPVTKTGTLIINPAPFYVNVENKRRLVGEANPALTVIFEGFIGEDILSTVLTKQVTLTTTASASSPVGSYPITSSGGAVTANYKLVHRPGTLVVEGVAGSYEALLKHPEGGLPNGRLALTVPGASRTFTASLRLGQETAAIAWSGSLSLSAQSRLATATLSKAVLGVVYELKVVLSMFGELNCEVRRAGVLVAAAEDGIRLLSLPPGQKAVQEGLYTAVLEPAQPAGEAVPAGAGWATVKVDATGKMTLTGRLADGTAFTAGLAADVAGRPGYRLFVQPYAPARKDSYVAGSFTLVPHPRLAGRSYVAGSTLNWVKAGQLKDLGYRSGFGPVTTTLRVDPWQFPTAASPLATRLELGLGGRWEVDSSPTGSLSEGALPTLVGVSATNVVSVVTPSANTRAWKMTVTPGTGAYMGTFELLDLTELRKVSFSGVLRQTPTTTDELIGAGHYLLPALKTAPSADQKSGAVVFWRPE